MHRSTLTAVVFLAACSGAAPQSQPSRPSFPATPSFPAAASMPQKGDARAKAVADRVMEALGGKEAWDRTRFLRFGFGGVRDGKWSGRTHHWDKWTGRYRVEGQTRDGKPFLTLMNLNTKEGSAWLDGGWVTVPAPFRDSDASVTVIREEDLADIEKELGKEYVKPSRWNFQALVPWSIPMNSPKRLRTNRLPAGGYSVAAAGTITYSEKEGAAWQTSTS